MVHSSSISSSSFLRTLGWIPSVLSFCFKTVYTWIWDRCSTMPLPLKSSVVKSSWSSSTRLKKKKFFSWNLEALLLCPEHLLPRGQLGSPPGSDAFEVVINPSVFSGCCDALFLCHALLCLPCLGCRFLLAYWFRNNFNFWGLLSHVCFSLILALYPPQSYFWWCFGLLYWVVCLYAGPPVWCELSSWCLQPFGGHPV